MVNEAMNLEWITTILLVFVFVLFPVLTNFHYLINKINFYAKSQSHNRLQDNDDAESDDDPDDIVWWTQPLLESTTRPLPTIPDEVIVEILVRLPVRSLLQFRSVCKSWKTLISSPQFAKDHFQFSTTNPMLTQQQLVCSTIDDYHPHECKFISCPVKSLLEWRCTPARAAKLRMRHGFSILGSCNGLLCLYDIFNSYVQLWNPSTRFRSERSPTVDSNPYYDVTYHGFGYDHVHDKYKVFVVIGNCHDPVTKVYTFGANSLTTIQDFPGYRISSGPLGKFVSGTLHWLAIGVFKDDPMRIITFDMGRDTCGELSLPDRDDDNLCYPALGVLRNCLCVCFEDKKSSHWVVSMMKEYGVEQSWTKLVIIPQGKIEFSGFTHTLEPLCIWENGFVLGRTAFFKLVLYNSNDGQLTYPITEYRMGSRRIGYESNLHIYNESLVSPC